MSRGALLLLLLAGCGGGPPPPVPPALPSPGVPFAYVDVAASMGYTMRNRTGKEAQKRFILEGTAPGIAVGDFNGDGWMDLYCPNGNDIVRYDHARREAVLLQGESAPRNALYLNEGGRRFREAGKASGVDDPLWAFGAVAGDLDNDGDTDLYVCNWGPNRLYRNRGDGSFDEVAGPSGAAGDPRAWSSAACLFDYDADGDLDIYVAQYADVEHLFASPHLTTMGPSGELDGRNCLWRKMRVACGPLGLMPLNDLLLENRLVESGELRFVDVSERAGIRMTPNACSSTADSEGPFFGFQPLSWDIDGDGRQDVFVTNDLGRNLCWMNRGDGTFEDRADLLGLAVGQSQFAAQASMGVGLGDIDGDLRQDLVISEFSHDEFNLLTATALPGGGVTYTERSPRTGLRAMTFAALGWGALLFDPDLDGDLDIFFACGHLFPEVDHYPELATSYRQYNLLVLNRDRTRLSLDNLQGRAGPGLELKKCTRAAVVIDFDNDGDPDIATNELNDTPSLLRCDIPRTEGPPHWLSIRLRGKPSERVPLDPAGAVVTLTAGEATTRRVFVIGSSFQSSEDPRLLFGLGAHAGASTAEVLWPNGRTTRHEGLEADRLHVVAYDGR